MEKFSRLLTLILLRLLHRYCGWYADLSVDSQILCLSCTHSIALISIGVEIVRLCGICSYNPVSKNVVTMHLNDRE